MATIRGFTPGRYYGNFATAGGACPAGTKIALAELCLRFATQHRLMRGGGEFKRVLLEAIAAGFIREQEQLIAKGDAKLARPIDQFAAGSELDRIVTR